MPTKPIYFISDLHLSEQYPNITDSFLSFLAGPAQSAQQLYILGDMFDVWMGDDLVNTYQRMIAQKLAELAANGVELFYLHGNRDFLVGKDYLTSAKLQLLADPSIITLNNTKVIVAHGDKLCTQDKAYQRYRKVARNCIIKFLFLKLPKTKRLEIANKLRQKSQRYQQQQELAILDVTDDAVKQLCSKLNCQQLIHGHVHKPKIHQYETTSRYVLGDWYKIGSVLEFANNQFKLKNYTVAAGLVSCS